jgi:hypothetical protein
MSQVMKPYLEGGSTSYLNELMRNCRRIKRATVGMGKDEGAISQRLAQEQALRFHLCLVLSK